MGGAGCTVAAEDECRMSIPVLIGPSLQPPHCWRLHVRRVLSNTSDVHTRWDVKACGNTHSSYAENFGLSEPAICSHHLIYLDTPADLKLLPSG